LFGFESAAPQLEVKGEEPNDDADGEVADVLVIVFALPRLLLFDDDDDDADKADEFDEVELSLLEENRFCNDEKNIPFPLLSRTLLLFSFGCVVEEGRRKAQTGGNSIGVN